jgi:hypothetical protein
MADRKSYLLRVDPALWEEIERLAQAELRSVNGQVEYLLREALAKRGLATRASRESQPSRASDDTRPPPSRRTRGDR